MVERLTTASTASKFSADHNVLRFENQAEVRVFEASIIEPDFEQAQPAKPAKGHTKNIEDANLERFLAIIEEVTQKNSIAAGSAPQIAEMMQNFNCI